MAWATGIPIATYNRLERGELSNTGVGYLANAAIVLDCDVNDLITDGMRRWRNFGRQEPPSDEWYERDEVRARAERWGLYKKQGDEPTVPFAAATPFPFARGAVFSFLDLERRGDALFKDAFEESLVAVLPRERRTAVGWVTGHVAESVVEAALVSLGWRSVWRFVEPGHRVDLLMLAPGGKRMFAVEVAGTLRAGHWPQLRRGPLTERDIEWLYESENKAMTEHGVKTEDVDGAIVLVNFHDLLLKAALTRDFVGWFPVEERKQLERVGWLTRK